MINPKYMRGRWYKIFVESNGTNSIITTIDKPIITTIIENGYLKCPNKFHVTEYYMDIDTNPITANATVPRELLKFADGRIGIKLPESAAITEATIYVFGYFE